MATLWTIDRALRDPNLLGAALGDRGPWKTWLAVLRAAFGLPLDEAEGVSFHAVAGDRVPPSRRVRELWAVVGRRGGKSRMAAALAVYAACFVPHRLSAGEVGHVLTLAASRDQAKVVFAYIQAFLEQSPVLRQEIESVTQTEIRLKSGIVLGTHANSFRSVRGRTLVAAIFDEVALWRDEVQRDAGRRGLSRGAARTDDHQGHVDRHQHPVSQDRAAASEAPRPLRRRTATTFSSSRVRRPRSIRGSVRRRSTRL